MGINKIYRAVVIGVSAGGLQALELILPLLPVGYGLPIMIVQHRNTKKGDFLYDYFNKLCHLNVIEADEKNLIKSGNVYFAPPNYHLQVEMDQTLSLSIDSLVNWSRPSIDVLFETAADVYREKLVGVILTGANNDGSKGLAKVKQFGGLAVIQDPKTAESPQMPMEALAATKDALVLSLENIGHLLADLNR